MQRRCLLLLVLLLTVGIVPIWAQSITLTKAFETMPNVKALDVYRNQFGIYEIVGADVPFPYAVIRVGLDGTPEDVKEAKERLSFQLGRVTSVETVFKDARNELLFLVPVRARNIQMSCDGACLPQMMFDSLGEGGYYWSNGLNVDDPKTAHVLQFNTIYDWYKYDVSVSRATGCFIRPVYPK
jgi:hypothetical protein